MMRGLIVLLSMLVGLFAHAKEMNNPDYAAGRQAAEQMAAEAPMPYIQGMRMGLGEPFANISEEARGDYAMGYARGLRAGVSEQDYKMVFREGIVFGREDPSRDLDHYLKGVDAAFDQAKNMGEELTARGFADGIQIQFDDEHYSDDFVEGFEDYFAQGA